ncbi:hypothetical protein OROMI_003227 [Orobanche minor]
MKTSSDQPKPQPATVRKLIVEVIEARNLLPKDGRGSSSPYVVAEFDGERIETSTVEKNLDPRWDEALAFIVTDPKNMESEVLNIEVFTGKMFSNGEKNKFLGRVKLYGCEFFERGKEVLVYHSLERKSVFSNVRGELGLKIYYYDEILKDEPPPKEEAPSNQYQPPEEVTKQPVLVVMEEPRPSMSLPTYINMEPREYSPPLVRIHEPPPETWDPPEKIPPPGFSPDMRRMQMCDRMYGPAMARERVRVVRRMPNADYSPKVIAGKFDGDTSERTHAFDLVEPMQYLFVRIVKARGFGPNGGQYVKIRTSGHCAKSKPSITPPGSDSSTNPETEWHQVFALGYNKETSANSTLEISVWDGGALEKFLGGVCFDLSDVPVRDPPDSPLAPRWYRLEGDGAGNDENGFSGDLQLSVWIGTQADDAFPESSSSDAPQSFVPYTRPKVYQAPKLWYLRLTVIEAQDLHIKHNLPPLTAPEIRVKGQLGFQSVRTRRGSMSQHTSAFQWKEDLIFVAGEPLEDSLIVLLEDRTGKDPAVIGHVSVPVGSIEQRLDESHVPAKWYNLEGGPGDNGSYFGKLHLRICLEGGYHVVDEAAHLCSDFRPTAKQLWNPPVGILELGILGAKGLLPMKTKGPGKGSTDPYCVAKYGKKWVRTRTVLDSLDPIWNEQYVWQVYDPCTVLTLGVFDNWRMLAENGKAMPDSRIGKVRVRVSTLETNKVYMSSYPLMVLSRNGLKKMGEIEVAVRFACPSMLPDTCGIYGKPLLPRPHYLRPLGLAQQETLRLAATRLVAAWLARSEPPLGSEVVQYMLDSDSHNWSMRKSKANWSRIVSVLAWAVGLAKWLDHIRWWRNPVTTALVHVLYLVLVWFPDLIVPTGFLYVFLMGVWYYRFRPKIPAGIDVKLSQVDTFDPDELDEEFDTLPSSRPPEVIRDRYDRLRILAARVQTVLGDFATQGERLQALVSWRDPRATKLFIGLCLAITIILYTVPAKMVAVALGFYFLRHPMFRDPMPPASLSFFRRLPGLSDRLL